MSIQAPPSVALDEALGREKLFAHLLMLLFAAMIAGSFSLGALALPHVAPVPLNALRFLLATIVMGIAAVTIGRTPLTIPKAPWRFGILGLLNAVYFVSMFLALAITAPVATSAVFTLTPLMSAIFGYLILRQSARPVVLASLFFAGLGAIWVIFRGDLNAILSFDVGQGELLYAAGCACYALYAVLSRKLGRGDNAMALSFWTLLAATLWIGAYGVRDILATDWVHLPAIVWWVLAYLAVFPTAVSFFCLQYAALRLPAAKVLAYGYLVPVFVILYEGLGGHGWASFGVLAGALVTVLGLVVLALSKDR
jgi:drug/metabolite transporter (DMT)-like permease